MHDVQDQFFDRVYWEPSVRAASDIGIRTPLGIAVVYDSRIHGSWPLMRDRATDRHGPVALNSKVSWLSHCVDERRGWLAGHLNPLLRVTVYRMDAFRNLIDTKNWDLAVPIQVRGVRIDEDVLMRLSPVRVSAEDETVKTLRLKTPAMRGADVSNVQQALVLAGFAVGVDGVFGPKTEAAVRRFQSARGLKVDGIVARPRAPGSVFRTAQSGQRFSSTPTCLAGMLTWCSNARSVTHSWSTQLGPLGGEDFRARSWN